MTVRNPHRATGADMVAKNALVVAAVCLIVVTRGTALADSHWDCKSNQQEFNDPYNQQFDMAYDEIIDACIDERREIFDETEELALNTCYEVPLSIDLRFRGPCPPVLIESEKPAYDGPDAAMAHTFLRSSFTRLAEDGSTVHFKYAESVRALRALLAKEPDNLLAMIYVKGALDRREDLIAGLNLEIRGHELDPSCSFAWAIGTNNIALLTMELLDNKEQGRSPGVELSDAAIAALVKRSWRALLSLYDHAYETSRNMRKLAFALASLNNPFLIDREEKVVRISAIIGVEPREYVANRRRQFIVDDLTKRFVVGARAVLKRTFSSVFHAMSPLLNAT